MKRIDAIQIVVNTIINWPTLYADLIKVMVNNAVKQWDNTQLNDFFDYDITIED